MYNLERQQTAILLLVHNNENQVNKLIKHLSNDFCVYIHIDKRSSLNLYKNKNINIYKKYKTYHGSYNQIIATLFLLKKAFINNHNRYLLISGQDIPVKSNREIIDFFNNNNSEYYYCQKLPRECWDGNGGYDRLTKYWNDNKNFRINIKSKFNILLRFKRKLLHILCKVENKIFKMINKEKKRKIDYEYFGGTNWFNFSHLCVKKIFDYLNTDKKYVKRYKWTSCADEIFYQTIIMKIDGININNDDLRYVDWENGPEYPKILRVDDYEKIIKSDKLFARKFDENIDPKIIEKIYEEIKE